MNKGRTATHVSFDSARKLGPPPEGNLAVPVLSHGTMIAELFSPVGVDPQQPHDRDEIYVVAQGEGEFFDGENVVRVEQGSFIFVPAGVPHHFQNFSEGFSVWVVFYGPAGGENRA
jgi:mannose-6-phosphate isomerase-like protein (cupin superfamily)